MILLENYAGSKQKSYKIMTMRMLAALEKAKPNIRNQRGLNLVAVKHTAVQMSHCRFTNGITRCTEPELTKAMYIPCTYSKERKMQSVIQVCILHFLSLRQNSDTRQWETHPPVRIQVSHNEISGHEPHERLHTKTDGLADNDSRNVTLTVHERS